jgi:hypothetical protein
MWWRIFGGLLLIITLSAFAPGILYDDIRYNSARERSIWQTVMWTGLIGGVICFWVGMAKRSRSYHNHPD